MAKESQTYETENMNSWPNGGRGVNPFSQADRKKNVFFYDFSKLGRRFFWSSVSNARQKYKSEIKNFSLYILLLEFLSLSLMSPARSVSEKKKQMTLRLSGSSDLKVKRYRGGGVLMRKMRRLSQCVDCRKIQTSFVVSIFLNPPVLKRWPWPTIKAWVFFSEVAVGMCFFRNTAAQKKKLFLGSGSCNILTLELV